MEGCLSHCRYVDECHILTFDDIASGPKRRKMGPCGSVEVLPPPAEGFTHSPYPLVDQFVLSQWTRGGVEPSIRKWTLFPHGWYGNQWVWWVGCHPCVSVVSWACGPMQGSAWCLKSPTTDGAKMWGDTTRATTSCERHTSQCSLSA